MKRELRSATELIKKGNITALPGKLLEYVIRRFPKLKSELNARKVASEIDKQEKSLQEGRADFSQITICFVLNQANPDLLTKSIFSIKKFLKDVHVVFIDMSGNTREIQEIIRNYLPKAELHAFPQSASLFDITSFVCANETTRDYLLFINEFVKFNPIIQKLNIGLLNTNKVYCLDFIHTRKSLRRYFIGTKAWEYYQNLQSFKSFFPLFSKELLRTSRLNDVTSRKLTVLPAGISVQLLTTEFDTKNLFYNYFIKQNEVMALESRKRIRDYRFPFNAKVSIIILTKDRIDLLSKCLSSIENSLYQNFEVIIIDHNSNQESQQYFNTLKYKVVRYEEEFNFSRMNNLGASYASGEVLCFLNNDTEVITKNWLEILGGFAVRDDVGAVSAKLLFKNKLVQHAGISVNKEFPISSHIATYEKNNQTSRELNVVSSPDAVTGACLVVDRKKFDHVGGFDENYSVVWQDIDICFKLESSGFMTLLIPYVSLYHHESSTRKAHPSDNEKKDDEYFKKTWVQKPAAPDSQPVRK